MQQLEDQQRHVREEQQHHHKKLARFLVQFQDEVRKIEKLQQVQATEADQTATAGTVGGVQEPKSFKPPLLLPFSGADPVPQDEASYKQWVWQAKKVLKSCTAGAVRIAIVQSVWGEVREFTATVGFEASVETLLEKVEDQLREK